MNKSGTLITSALLTFGIAAGAMAADMPKTAAPMAADTPACGRPRPDPVDEQRKVDQQEARQEEEATAPAPSTK